MTPLTGQQSKIMTEFYACPKTRVLFTKRERQTLWRQATSRDRSIDFVSLKAKCPALEHQIRKSYKGGHNIQSAVFSECVYAQTFANMFCLPVFTNCDEDDTYIPQHIILLLSSYHLTPRYVYSTENKHRMLIQAGGCNGIDSALITVLDLDIYTIEFKEPAAKTSEPDLPKYTENGNFCITKDFLERYPQFETMLSEQSNLNFFDCMGRNVNNFTPDSIRFAVANNYAKKYADVICTEDIKGNLVMLPANQVGDWAQLEGEIRPAGRNHYDVWTPNALRRFLHEKGAQITDERVSIRIEQLTERRQRGGNRVLSGYKINPLFFVYAVHCTEDNGNICFDIKHVQQLNPTIAGKMFFRDLNYDKVKSAYIL